MQPRQTESSTLQGRAQRGAKPMAEQSLSNEGVHQVSLDPWRDPASSRLPLASLVLTSPQSSSDQRAREIHGRNTSESSLTYKIRKQTLCRCLPTLRAVANNQILYIIIDTGATINLMNANIAKAMHTRAATDPISVSDISGNSQRLSEIVTVPLELSGYPYVFDFYVTPTLPGDALLGMEAIIEAGWIVDPIDRVLLHKTHALPPIRLHPCIHESHAMRTKQKCTLAPMSWQRVSVEDSKPLLLATAKTCILIPSLLPIFPFHGAPTVHNSEDQEKFVLLCNMSSEPIDIPADATVAHQEIAYDIEEPSLTTIPVRDSVLSNTIISSKSDRKSHCSQADKLKSSTEQIVEKHFDLTSTKQLWDPKFVKSLKRLLLTMAIT